MVGALELLGAIGLLVPRTTVYAALGLVAVMLGAAITHITHGEVMMLPLPIIPMLLLAVIVYTWGRWSAKTSTARGRR